MIGDAPGRGPEAALPVPAEPRPVAGNQAAALEDAIHALAQPLTALSFVLDLASLRSEAEAWRQAIEAGRVECRRAVIALHQVRTAAMPGTQLLSHTSTGMAGETW